MKAAFYVLFLFFLTLSCSKSTCNIGGHLLFETEFDGLLHTDKLFLYDNGTFRIDMSDFGSCGNYSMKEDTIELEYLNTNSSKYNAFVISNGFVFGLERQNGQWVKLENNAFMPIIKNQLYLN